tara:strand:- start:684 stop:950 length:267 start_codon:yes stop_codon:yes gene_type:complete
MCRYQVIAKGIEFELTKDDDYETKMYVTADIYEDTGGKLSAELISVSTMNYEVNIEDFSQSESNSLCEIALETYYDYTTDLDTEMRIA